MKALFVNFLYFHNIGRIGVGQPPLISLTKSNFSVFISLHVQLYLNQSMEAGDNPISISESFIQF